MIDPELGAAGRAVADGPGTWRTRSPPAGGFEAMVAGLSHEIPAELGVTIEDRSVAGWEGDPDSAGPHLPAQGGRFGPGAGHRHDPRRRLRGGQHRDRAPRCRHDGRAYRSRSSCRSSTGWLPNTRIPPRSTTVQRTPVRPRRGAGPRRGPRAHCAGRVPVPAVGCRQPQLCSPGIVAARPCASRCCTSPSSTTGWRRRPCGRSSTHQSGTAHSPRRAGSTTSGISPAPTTCRPTPRPLARATSRACRRRTCPRPRTTRYATRASSTPWACSRPASQWSCTSSRARSTVRPWWSRPRSRSGPRRSPPGSLRRVSGHRASRS